jgi:hypothetical protein
MKNHDELWVELQDVLEELNKFLSISVGGDEKYQLKELVVKCSNSIREMEQVIRPTLSVLKIKQADEALEKSKKLISKIKAVSVAKVAEATKKNDSTVKNSSDEEYEWYSKMSEKELNDLIEKHGDI